MRSLLCRRNMTYHGQRCRAQQARYLSARNAVPEHRSPRPTVNPPKLNIYRDVWPPLIKAAGIAFAVYYSLELYRTNLDYKYQVRDMAVEVEALKAHVEGLREAAESRQGLTASGSKHRAEANGQYRSKWLGIF